MGRYSGTAYNRRHRRMHWRYNPRKGGWRHGVRTGTTGEAILGAVVTLTLCALVILFASACKPIGDDKPEPHPTIATPAHCTPVAGAEGVCSVPLTGHYAGCDTLYGLADLPFFECSTDDGWQPLPGGFRNVAGGKATLYPECWINAGQTHSYVACRDGGKWFRKQAS